MTIQDPIADLITQIRNGYTAKKDYITVFSSKIKIAILNILKKELFIDDFTLMSTNSKKQQLKITLKYYGKKVPILKKIQRISKPSLKVYSKYKKLQNIANGFGISILSTTYGILTNKEAKKRKCGGEIICIIE